MFQKYVLAMVLLFSSFGCYGGWRDCFPCCQPRREIHSSEANSEESGPKGAMHEDDADDGSITIIGADQTQTVLTREDIARHNGNLVEAAVAARLAQVVTDL